MLCPQGDFNIHFFIVGALAGIMIDLGGAGLLQIDHLIDMFSRCGYDYLVVDGNKYNTTWSSCKCEM